MELVTVLRCTIDLQIDIVSIEGRETLRLRIMSSEEVQQLLESMATGYSTISHFCRGADIVEQLLICGIQRNINIKNSMTFEEQTEKIVEALRSNFLVKNLPIAACQIRQPVLMPETGKIIYYLGDMEVCTEMCWNFLRAVRSRTAALTTSTAGDATSAFDSVTIASHLQYIGDQSRGLDWHIDTVNAEILEGKNMRESTSDMRTLKTEEDKKEIS
ncbi:uncharacterized protein LOC143836679 [Paroedura picta]|uniref:uncharacterized protein LOC143836679 n=1 Tax=Paroedura picta TaxID=143630 RepID=UPI004057C890